MLKAMRKHATYFYFLFVIIIVTFIFWGVGGNKQDQLVSLVEIDGDMITWAEYRDAYNWTVDAYREVYPDNFDEIQKKLNIKEMVIDTLINDRILAKAADDMGVTVSDSELRDSIINNPSFQQDGNFNKDLYVSRLKNSKFRYTPKAFEAKLRQELLLKKMKNLIEGSVELMPHDTAELSGNEEIIDTIKTAILKDKQDKALKSFINGIKKTMAITETPRLKEIMAES